MRIAIPAWGFCLILLIGSGVEVMAQRSTLADNFGVGKERTLVSRDGAYFASDPTNADQKKRFVLGFEVSAEPGTVRLVLKRVKGINYDNNQDATYFTVSSCVLDEEQKCGKMSAPVPLRSVDVEVGKGQQLTTILIATAGAPLGAGARPYYDVYSPTFSPRLLIKVSNEQQQQSLRSLLK
jgi:predicted metal-binding protein